MYSSLSPLLGFLWFVLVGCLVGWLVGRSFVAWLMKYWAGVVVVVRMLSRLLDRVRPHNVLICLGRRSSSCTWLGGWLLACWLTRCSIGKGWSSAWYLLATLVWCDVFLIYVICCSIPWYRGQFVCRWGFHFDPACFVMYFWCASSERGSILTLFGTGRASLKVAGAQRTEHYQVAAVSNALGQALYSDGLLWGRRSDCSDFRGSLAFVAGAMQPHVLLPGQTKPKTVWRRTNLAMARPPFAIFWHCTPRARIPWYLAGLRRRF